MPKAPPQSSPSPTPTLPKGQELILAVFEDVWVMSLTF